MEKYNLSSEWNIWYHSINDTNWNKNSYQNLYTIKNLYDWGRKNKKCLEDSALELLQLNKIKPKTKLGLVKILNLCPIMYYV